MTNEEIKHIFRLYLEGSTSPEQEQILFSFVREHQDSELFFKDIIEETWNKDVDVWQDKPTKRSGYWLKYAASLLLICSVALGWYLTNQPDKIADKQIALISKITRRGEKLKLILPDSSVVFLNVASKISFPERFEHGKTRHINLEGEAFFEVKHDASRPFIVHSGALQTQVLGTSFNVMAYAESKTLSVAVRTGKVGVSVTTKGKQEHLSLLTPGNRLVYELNSRQYKIDQQKPSDLNAWTENHFIFKNETLATIISSLERSYDIVFKVKDTKILSCRFNAAFFNKNIKDIADQLNIMSGGKLHYKFSTDKKIITLWGEACQ